MLASETGSSKRWISPTRSARQLAVQAISTPCSVSRLTSSGVLGWLHSPGRNKVPFQSRSPDDGAPSPTVGAKCQGLGATYANGWLIMVGASRTSPVPRNGMRRRYERRQTLPRFGALLGYNTPSPALRGLRVITKAQVIQWCSLRCVLEAEEGKASSLHALGEWLVLMEWEPFAWVP